MEGLHRNSKMARMSTQLLRGNLENVDVNSPLFRYLCAQSQSPSPMDALKQQRRRHHPPLSPVDNLVERSPPSTIYRTPMRAVQKEEVLVMDGILVPGGGRSSRSSSDISSSSSSDSSGKTLYQFAHGKEKLRPTCFPVKNKPEAQTCKSYTGTQSCTPSPKSRFAHQVRESSVTEAAAAATKHAVLRTVHKSTIRTPQDDGIEVVLPHSSTGTPPSWKDIDSYINDVLYGPTTRRRLPVFVEICPE